MLVCDKCGTNNDGENDVAEAKYEFAQNGQDVFTLHADFCKMCREKIERKVIKQMDIELKR
jgi:hypothetical protein